MFSSIKPAGDDFRDTLATVDKTGRRRWVYSNIVDGFYLRARTVVASALLVLYLCLPWISIGGKQAVFLDILHRRFTFFGTTFWATDTLFLALVFLGLALSLFFFTALFGRVWCGWACPETIFLEFVFRPIERLIEGNASSRARLDRQPWNLEKIWKKSLKHGICAAVSWFIASTFLAYFIGREPLLLMMQDWPANNLTPFTLTILMMFLFAFQFGWFREQFCTVLCPYARFQSVLMDANSLVVGYDNIRGEPRGKAKSAQPKKGDCIDCKQCVRVCPTGIDIRNGLQLECVSCTQCIDACDSIMVSIGKPKGLIRYDTENKLCGKKSKILRPRLFLYGLLLVIYGVIFIYFIETRSTSEFQVLRPPLQNPFVRLDDNFFSNQFTIRVTNKSDDPREYYFALDSITENIELIVPGGTIRLMAQETKTTPIFVKFSKEVLSIGTRKIKVKVKDDHGYMSEQEISLLGPSS